MLKNLAYEMPNLQEKTKDCCLEYFNEEVFKTILSSKCIVDWNINNYNDEEIEASNLPSNYSIKYLEINYGLPAPLALKIINSCKNLKNLNLKKYMNKEHLDWSKIERRVNILK
ncbi:hypothetical protein CONCODRAFT_13979 [Conidiobolus coronatus NRRL 28638]|uniref:F-box domain-containing protein n=1 Tax=Conidiobolus coronatus (strain ATCC 28846 / CBS 209.66 / NRRL 28638) TaxID=796925 RepID=A0A137NPT0_CONC2|nr:hypothetical protein CONCODRAFT_13979 [Conidiobolus coronatus NRRL 28638]|eukprot:KXN64755.1 hypothetical protein CONCODRAFT_13979 [Conidiobolus coronatus NRRL 28638]